MKKILLCMLCIIGLSTCFVSASNEPFTISGTHKIEGINSGTRTIILEDQSNGNKEEKTIEVNNPFTFTVSNLSNVGDYIYKLYQDPINAEGLTQDTSVYTIELYVRNNENVMVIKDKDGEKIEKIEFVDSFVEPPTPSKPEPEPEVKKPSITTSLSDKNGNKKLEVSKNTIVYDNITYKNFEVGKEYIVYGNLIVKDTKKELTVNKEIVEGSTIFTVEEGEENGTVKVEFKFDSTGLEGKTLVAFETVGIVKEVDGNINEIADIAEHKDINDKEQMVYFKTKNIIERITPKTGDSNNIFILSGIFILAMIGIITIVVRKRKS